jgi:hypothetical protein
MAWARARNPGRRRLFQIHREDGRHGAAGSDDLVVDRFQLGGGLAEQDDGGAPVGAGERGGAAEALAGAGDQDDPALLFEGEGRVMLCP